MTYGHLRTDCLYTGISSGPNARYRVWEAFTFTFTFYTLTVFTGHVHGRLSTLPSISAPQHLAETFRLTSNAESRCSLSLFHRLHIQASRSDKACVFSGCGNSREHIVRIDQNIIVVYLAFREI